MMEKWKGKEEKRRGEEKKDSVKNGEWKENRRGVNKEEGRKRKTVEEVNKKGRKRGKERKEEGIRENGRILEGRISK